MATYSNDFIRFPCKYPLFYRFQNCAHTPWEKEVEFRILLPDGGYLWQETRVDESAPEQKFLEHTSQELITRFEKHIWDNPSMREWNACHDPVIYTYNPEDFNALRAQAEMASGKTTYLITEYLGTGLYFASIIAYEKAEEKMDFLMQDAEFIIKFAVKLGCVIRARPSIHSDHYLLRDNKGLRRKKKTDEAFCPTNEEKNDE